MVPRDKKRNGKSADETQKVRVDLGFSNLIASLNAQPPASDIPESSQPIEIKTSLGEDLSLQKPIIPSQKVLEKRTSFEGLAEARQWGELATFAESQMSNSKGSANALATIWWGLAQLELGSIPPSVLTSPIQRASAEVERFSVMASGSLVEPALTSARIQKETAGLLLRLAKRSVASVSDSTAPEFFRRAAVLDKSLSDDIRSLLEREIDKLNKMTGRKSLREARIAQFKAICVDLQDLNAPLNTAESGAKGSLESRVDKSKVANYNPNVATTHTQKSWLGPTSLLLIIFFAGALSVKQLGVDQLFNKSESSGRGAAGLVAYSYEASGSAPQISRIQSVDNLEVLLAKVNSMAISSSSSGTSRALGRQPSQISAPAEMGGLLENKPPSNKTGEKLEKIDTSGPLEGTPFYERELRASSNSSDSVFGSEPPGVGGFHPNNSSGPRVYRVLTFTRVYSKASFFSQTIANLDSGARVEVVERLGEWLKIRSKSGQIGFMLAQDAEQLR